MNVEQTPRIYSLVMEDIDECFSRISSEDRAEIVAKICKRDNLMFLEDVFSTEKMTAALQLVTQEKRDILLDLLNREKGSESVIISTVHIQESFALLPTEVKRKILES